MQLKRRLLLTSFILVFAALSICAAQGSSSSALWEASMTPDYSYRAGSSLKNAKYVLGIDFPNFGWAINNDRGELAGYRGFNVGIGYSQKNYFKPYRDRTFNPYWSFGTIGLFVPYVGVGGDYAVPLDERSNLNLGAGIMLVLFVPAPYVSISYTW